MCTVKHPHADLGNQMGTNLKYALRSEEFSASLKCDFGGFVYGNYKQSTRH